MADVVFRRDVFFNWDPLKGASFIGLKNFVKLMGDKLWWTSLANTLFYIVLNVPLIILLALAMSELVVALAKRSMFLSKLFKSVYFLPAVLSLVATSIAWRYLLNTNTGSINGILVTLGLDPVGWFTNSKLAMLSIVIITTWRWAGYYMVSRILDNYARLTETNVQLYIRVPLVHAVNDTEENIALMHDFLKRFPPAERLELLHYHNLGRAKADGLGWDQALFQAPEAARILQIRDALEGCAKAILIS